MNDLSLAIYVCVQALISSEISLQIFKKTCSEAFPNKLSIRVNSPYESLSKAYETDSINDRISELIDSSDKVVASGLLASAFQSKLPVPITVVSLFCTGAIFVGKYLPYVEPIEVSGVIHVGLEQFQAIHGCILSRGSRRELKRLSQKFSMNQKLDHGDGKITIRRRKIVAKSQPVRYDPQFTLRKWINGQEVFFPVGQNKRDGLKKAKEINEDIDRNISVAELRRKYHPNSKPLKKLEEAENPEPRIFDTGGDSGKLPHVTLERAVSEYLATKEPGGHTYRQARDLLRRFKAFAGVGVCLNQVDTKTIRAYLKSIPKGSYNNHLTAVKGLFKWSFEERFLRDNPCDRVKKKKRLHKEPEIVSVELAKKLIEAAENMYDGELLAYAVITLFAGLRPDSEMSQLLWSDINLEDSEIVVRKGKRCTPRTVELDDSLVQWLLECDQSVPIYPDGFREKWSKIRVAAGFRSGQARTENQKERDAKLIPWVRDYTRHTAISFKVRQTGDITKTATWAGNSPDTIRSHYLGRVTGADAKKFWAIVPKSINA